MAGATIYRYRPHITWGMYIIPAFFGMCILLLLTSLAAMLVASEPPPQILIVAICIALVVPVAIVFLLWRLYYRMAGVRIRIEETELWYGHRNGNLRIPLDTIERIEFPSIKYTGGWLKVVSGKETLRFTVVIQGIGNLLIDLKEAMDRCGLQDRYDRRKFFSFYKTAVYSDQSWDRMYTGFWRFVLLVVVMVIPGFFLVRGTGFVVLGMLLWAVACWLLATGIYLVSEVLFGRRVAKLSNEEAFTCPSRDSHYEKSVYRKASIVMALIYLAALLLVLAVR